jgi:CBS domain-containing protein
MVSPLEDDAGLGRQPPAISINTPTMAAINLVIEKTGSCSAGRREYNPTLFTSVTKPLQLVGGITAWILLREFPTKRGGCLI